MASPQRLTKHVDGLDCLAVLNRPRERSSRFSPQSIQHFGKIALADHSLELEAGMAVASPDAQHLDPAHDGQANCNPVASVRRGGGDDLTAPRRYIGEVNTEVAAASALTSRRIFDGIAFGLSQISSRKLRAARQGITSVNRQAAPTTDKGVSIGSSVFVQRRRGMPVGRTDHLTRAKPRVGAKNFGGGPGESRPQLGGCCAMRRRASARFEALRVEVAELTDFYLGVGRLSYGASAERECLAATERSSEQARRSVEAFCLISGAVVRLHRSKSGPSPL